MPRGIYIRTEEHRRLLREAKERSPVWNKGMKDYLSKEVRERITNNLIGRTLTEEHRKNIGVGVTGEKNGNYGKDLSGENNPSWIGGHKQYWHKLARQLFGKEKCEICGRTNEEEILDTGKQLAMHCTSIPKDYKLMEESNWKTLCIKCHASID